MEFEDQKLDFKKNKIVTIIISKWKILIQITFYEFETKKKDAKSKQLTNKQCHVVIYILQQLLQYMKNKEKLERCY